MPNGDYTHSELLSMQRDAVRRVNEMQRIAREKLAGTAKEAQGHPQSGHESKQQAVPAAAPHQKEPSKPASPKEAVPISSPCESSDPLGALGAPLVGFLDRLDLDSETLMIIMMLMLLINDGSDSLLILALVYILL